jgi:hypothetical protein
LGEVRGGEVGGGKSSQELACPKGIKFVPDLHIPASLQPEQNLDAKAKAKAKEEGKL